MSLDTSQKRFLEIYTATEGKPFTIDSLVKSLKIAADNFLYGRKLKYIVSDLVADKLATKDKNGYAFTKNAQQLLKPPKEEFSEAQFLAELGVALEKSEKTSFREYRPIGEGNKVTHYVAPPKEESIPIPEVHIPAPPVKATIPRSTQEALKNFDSNFTERPNETIQQLSQMVVNQRIQLQAQDQVIRQMHELLSAYVARAL